MSRSGYTDDIDQRDLAMWRGRVASSIRGKRGQSLLKNLAKALDEMSVKRLVRDVLIDGDDVCLLGAGARAMQLPSIDAIDPEDHDMLSGVFNVASCLIQEIESVNDEAAGREETPEERFVRVRKWLDENIVQDAAPTAR